MSTWTFRRFGGPVLGVYAGLCECTFFKTWFTLHTLEQEVEMKYWYWNGYLLQVLQILLRDDVIARARITASEVCVYLFAMFSDCLVSSPHCKFCSYLSLLLLHFQQNRVVLLFTHQIFHINLLKV